MTAVMTSVLQVVTCNIFDAFDLLHILILLCLKAVRLGRETLQFMPCEMAWEIGGWSFSHGRHGSYINMCFAMIIILLKPVVVRKRGIYEGEKGVS